MSAFDRAIRAIRDVLLLQEQMTQMRGDMQGLSQSVASLAGDMRDFDRRLARVEGFIEGATARSVRQPRLPKP